MPRIYTYPTTLNYMRQAAEFYARDIQVYGVAADGLSWNPYMERREEDGSSRYHYSPVGAALSLINVDLSAVEEISERHNRLCADMDCKICSEEGGYADTSLYAPWVQDWLEERDVVFTDRALDLLWQAECSGLALYEWLEIWFDDEHSV